ncbi:hypothetical protein LZF95_15270 [Algoriphagus sp. AGSA1]|uniref:HYC_CC_PP family protein n=1 Tax=Algoriphagus sp. AGSA1 TaxID=2907213 RepID=UPI001F1F3638|nr:hypothetical protein [Algoriphagus sp. AGSA1]MCE7056041.1 hypothetical protein [Algoriphagus sp. AGSA1]
MKKQISIALALLLMFSNIGMAKSTHLCMGSEMMAEFGIAIKHLDCGMGNSHEEELPDSEQSINPIECCQNQFELVQNDKDQNLKVLQIDAAQLVFIAAFTQSFIFNIAVTSDDRRPQPYLIPPTIEKDFNVLFQSFLI